MINLAEKGKDFWFASKKNQFIVIGAISLLLLLLPFILPSNYTRGIAIKVLLYVILASSLNIINGYTGQMNIGHAGLVCIGAYAAGIIGTKFGISFWLLVIICGLVTSVFGYIMSKPAIKLEGIYLAIVTMGCSEVIRLIALNWTSFTGGPMGIRGIPRPELFGMVLKSTTHYYYIALFLAVVTLFCVYRVINSRLGRAWISIREDQLASRFLGVDVNHYKTVNFMLGAFFAGVGGCFLTYYYQYISSDMFTVDETFNIMAMVIIGGQGTLLGPIVGSLIVNLLTEAFRFTAEYRFVIYALLIIGMMWLRPQGLVGAKNSVFASKNVKRHRRKRGVVINDNLGD